MNRVKYGPWMRRSWFSLKSLTSWTSFDVTEIRVSGMEVTSATGELWS